MINFISENVFDKDSNEDGVRSLIFLIISQSVANSEIIQGKG